MIRPTYSEVPFGATPKTWVSNAMGSSPLTLTGATYAWPGASTVQAIATFGVPVGGIAMWHNQTISLGAGCAFGVAVCHSLNVDQREVSCFAHKFDGDAPTGLVAQGFIGWAPLGWTGGNALAAMPIANFTTAHATSSGGLGLFNTGWFRPAVALTDFDATALAWASGVIIRNPTAAAITISSWKATFEKTDFVQPDLGILAVQ